jgi:hypothetical protein
MPSQATNQSNTVSVTQGGSTRLICTGGVYGNRSWTNSSPSWSAYYGRKPWELPINSYSDEDWKIHDSSFATQVRKHWSYPNGESVMYYGYGPAVLDAIYTWGLPGHEYATSALASVNSLSNEAVIRALNRAADVKLNMPVATAEAGKTAKLITSTANRLLHFYRSFRRGDYPQAARELGLTPGTVHKTVLEYKYGWMPLLMEVKGAAEALAETHFPRPPVFRVRQTAESTREGERTRANQYGFQGFGNALVYEFYESSRRVKHDIWFEVVNPQFSFANQVGLTNPLAVLWELTPFSFVFDWLIQVGDWLQALTAMHGLKVLRSMRSRLDTVRYSREINEFDRTVDGIFCPAFKTADRMDWRYYKRETWTLSVSSLYPPVNTDPFRWGRLIAGLALLKAQARRYETVRV